MNFDFSAPITWSDIISTFSLISAVVAAIIAIRGNRQSQKQFEKDMNLQIQSINLELFDERVKILSILEHGEYDFSQQRFSLLFNQEISNKLTRVKELFQVYQEDQANLTYCNKSLQEKISSNNSDDFPNFPNLIGMFNDYRSGKCEKRISHEQYQEIERILKKYPQEIVLDGKVIGSYTYPELCDKLDKSSDLLKLAKETLVKSVDDFVKSTKNSIKEAVQ